MLDIFVRLGLSSLHRRLPKLIRILTTHKAKLLECLPWPCNPEYIHTHHMIIWIILHMDMLIMQDSTICESALLKHSTGSRVLNICMCLYSVDPCTTLAGWRCASEERRNESSQCFCCVSFTCIVWDDDCKSVTWLPRVRVMCTCVHCISNFAWSLATAEYANHLSNFPICGLLSYGEVEDILTQTPGT